MPGESRVTVRTLTRYSEMVALEGLQRQIWRSPEPYTPRMLLAISRTGGQVLGAFLEGRLVGFSVALFANDEEGAYLFSQALGVLRELRSQGIGRLLKSAQRDYALSLGITRVKWTFDPLLARTAYFHCATLGAIGVSYAPDYYDTEEGREGELIAGQRVVAFWDIKSRRVEERLSGARPSEAEGVWITQVRVEDGVPFLLDVAFGEKASRLLIEIPGDLEPFRGRKEALRKWRLGVGELLDRYLNGEGYILKECFAPFREGMRRPYYLLERKGPGVSG